MNIFTLTCSNLLRWMRFMWIPLAMWNHPTDGFKALEAYPKKVGLIALLIKKDGECNLIFVKISNPNITKLVAKSTCITNPTKLEQLYYRLETKNKCLVNVANQFGLIYLIEIQTMSSN